MSQLFLFTGENHFTLVEEKCRWLASFREKHGEENLIRLDAKGLSYTALLDEISSAPFIAEKRLVVIEGIPRLEKEQVRELEKQVHPDALILFCEQKPDKRFAAVKELLKIADVKDFASLRGQKLSDWMQSFLAELGASMQPEAQTLLLQSVGEDQEYLSQELRKLALYAGDRPINAEDVEKLVVYAAEQVAWKLLDLLASGNTGEAFAYAQKLLEHGESPHALWSRLLWMVSQLVLVAGAVQDGQTNPGAITKSTGVNFASARTLIPFARSIDTDALRALVDRFADADRGIKTGDIRTTVDSPEELLAVIDTCVCTFSGT